MNRDEAVSSVVSAVLVVTLFTAAFGVWTVETMPEWIKDREDTHARAIGAAMGGATADILASATAGRPGATALSFPLAAEPIPLLQSGAGSGTLELVEGFGWSFTATNHAPVMTGGMMRSTPTSTTADQVARLLSLEFNSGTLIINDASVATPPLKIQSSACNGSGQTVTVWFGAGQSTAPSSSLVRQSTHSCPTGATINALDPAFGLSAALEELQVPLTIGTATFAAAWIDSDGVTRSTAATATGSSWTATGQDKAAFRYTGEYSALDERQVIMEAGAVINKQDSGASFTSTPPLSFGGDTNAGALRWTMTSFDGTGSVSGRSVATANLVATSTSERIIYVPSGATTTFALDKTLVPAAWTQAWGDAAQLAGFALDTAAGCGTASTQVCVASTTDTATLTLKSSIPWTIHLTIVHVDVRVT